MLTKGINKTNARLTLYFKLSIWFSFRLLMFFLRHGQAIGEGHGKVSVETVVL